MERSGPARALVIVTICALASACTSTTRYKLSFDSPVAQAGAACAAACDRGGKRDKRYFKCLRECPGFTRESGACRPEDRPPYGICAERKVNSAKGAGGLVLLVLAIASIVATVKRTRSN